MSQRIDTTNDTTTDAILALVTQWADAERRGDDGAITALLVDDFRLVGPLGFILTRDQMGQRYGSGNLKHAAFVVSEPTVRAYGDTAIVIATQTQQSTFQDRDASGQFRITLVAMRDGDRWRFAGMHLSPIAPPR